MNTAKQLYQLKEYIEKRDFPIRISLETCYDSYGLYARKLWEVLFRLTDFHKTKNFDSFLCDLEIFEKRFKEEQKVFYWTYNSESGYTDVTDFYVEYCTCLKIEYIPFKEIIISKEQGE